LYIAVLPKKTKSKHKKDLLSGVSAIIVHLKVTE